MEDSTSSSSFSRILRHLLWLLLLLNLVCSPMLVASEEVQKMCINMCMCVRHEQTIDCNTGDTITSIPKVVPLAYNKLFIQHGMFHSNILSRQNMSGLNHLVQLKIIYSRLHTIQSHTFIQMEQLDTLDLSANQLQVLETRAFAGLRLKSLYLQDNVGLQLNPGAFRELQVKEISLRNNGLKVLHYETFASLGLERLLLFNNLITRLDPRFKDIFDSPTKIIDLTKNPLHCSCQVKWYLTFLQQVISRPENKDISVVCDSPDNLRGKVLHRMVGESLTCPPVVIREVQIDLNPHQFHLQCLAEGNPPPGMSWRYQQNGQMNVHRREPQPWSVYQYQQGTSGATDVSSIDVNVSTLSWSRPVQEYTCSAWSQDREEQKAEILLRIKAPASFALRPTPASEGVAISDNSPSSSSSSHSTLQQNFLFRKQFSLLELVLAIVGTFVSTVVFLILLFRCVHCFRHRRERLKSPANPNIYWSTHASAYSGTEGHEYDVPRLVDHHVPYQPVQRDELELLDFKTQRKLHLNGVC